MKPNRQIEISTISLENKWNVEYYEMPVDPFTSMHSIYGEMLLFIPGQCIQISYFSIFIGILTATFSTRLQRNATVERFLSSKF